MNKAIIIAAVVLSLVFGYQNVFMDFNQAGYTEMEVTIEIPEEVIEDGIPDGAEVVGYVYLDADTDIFITIPSGNWEHQKADGMTVFFDSNAEPHYVSIAISSSILPVSEDEQDEMTDLFFDEAVNNLSTFLEDATFEQLDNFDFNEYSAYRHVCSGTMYDSDVSFSVEYMYWWIGDRSYTVSLFCSSEVYEKYSDILHDALMTFQPASELG